jgi:hypothetical protein
MLEGLETKEQHALTYMMLKEFVTSPSFIVVMEFL